MNTRTRRAFSSVGQRSSRRSKKSGWNGKVDRAARLAGSVSRRLVKSRNFMRGLLHHFSLQEGFTFGGQATDALLVHFDKAQVGEYLDRTSQPGVAHADLVEAPGGDDLRSIDLEQTPLPGPGLLVGH